MIDAREARIVYEENEYKNSIRNLLEAQKEMEEAIKRKQEELAKEIYCEEILQPVYDKIAEASADGYNSIELYLSDFSYKTVRGYGVPYSYNLNVRPIPCTVCA